MRFAPALAGAAQGPMQRPQKRGGGGAARQGLGFRV